MAFASLLLAAVLRCKGNVNDVPPGPVSSMLPSQLCQVDDLLQGGGATAANLHVA